MSLDKRSIELGTEGWGVKEDNLLAFRKDRTRYVEKPFTFSRASEGTIINSDGYIQYSGLGDELVTNGTFDEDASWQKDSSWSIGGGKATYDGISHVQDIRQNVAFQSGRLYKITFTISDVDEAAGKKAYFALWTVSNGSDQVFNYTNFDNGTYIYYYTPTNGSILMFNALNNVDGGSFSLDNVSVKQVEQETPRISYDIVDGVVSDKPHLLLEPARTNLITYSEIFSTGWGFDDSSILNNDSISPSGVKNATLLKGNTTSSRHYRLFTKVNSVTAVLSVFVKAKELRYVQIASANTVSQHANFDVLDGVIGNVGSGFSDAKIEDYGNGWYRCSVASVNQYNNIYISLVSGLDSPWLEVWSMPNDTDGLYIWGAQIEEGTYLSSYIPTHGLIETRSAETANNCGAAQDFNDDEGVFYAEIAALADSLTWRQITINDGSPNNTVVIAFKDTSNTLHCQYRLSNVPQADLNYVFSNDTDFHKVAFRYALNDFSMYVNGVKVVPTDTSGGVLPQGTLNQIDFSASGNLPFHGKVKELKVYTETLNDAELRLLTKYAPKDYDAAFTADYVDNLAEFTVLRTEATDKLYYSISDGTNSVSGSATIIATQVTISNIDISSLSDGTLTLSVYIEDERKQRGVTVTDTTIKDTTNTPLYSYALQQRATGATFEDLDNSESIIESLNVEV